ncbi:hypothetical protein ACIOKD_38090 [Streptomyces sp. NPDC087844]|uniref:hypothetical protein n=1 Tax=Streptomyces sp. NPDC087844 TaxID=3365805 RepID=UPI0037FD2452
MGEAAPPAGSLRARARRTHEHGLRTMAYRSIDATSAQNCLLSRLALQGEDLTDAERVAEQFSLDQAREDRWTAEAVSDRIRGKFGLGVIGPAAILDLRRAS